MSTYLPDKTIFMLPTFLTSSASLNPGCDRLTMSVLVEVEKDGTIVKSDIHESVINSVAKLAYEDAQKMIETKPLDSKNFEVFNKFNLENVSDSVQKLFKLGNKIKEKNHSGNAIRKKCNFYGVLM